MIARARAYAALLRQYGLGRCLWRAAYDIRRRRGWLKRRFPAYTWQQRPLHAWLRTGVPAAPEAYVALRNHASVKFFFEAGAPPAPSADWTRGAREESERLLAGEFRYFFAQYGQLGYPAPAWSTNPFTGQRDEAARHWCDSDDFEFDRGDVKVLWEPSRFGWAYALARAYAADADERWPEAFWLLVEHWMRSNPPQIGPHWSCGQEIAIRLLACTFALYAFWRSPATTPARVVRLVTMLAASAERIAGNIDAARNQMGNHATSEAAGVYTVGVLFPELAGADRWRALGRVVLDDEARRFNFDDGAYIQHSMNYQRLMLYSYIWCMRLAELNGDTPAPLTRRRMAAALDFMQQMQDGSSGRVPNYGPNDGALAPVLSDCDYLDYRPMIGALHYLLARRRCFDPGRHDEDLLWLFGPDALAAPIERPALETRDFTNGGYYTFRGGRSWGFVRCHTYRSRPNQADMLHLDVWWAGVNVLRDSGTFSYYDPTTQLNRYFVSTAAHNTVRVAGQDQMEKGPRFQWRTLLRSRFLGRGRAGDAQCWCGEHDGYSRLPSRAIHRRTIARLADPAVWLVIDDVTGAGDEQTEIRWQLPDLPAEQTDDGVHISIGPDIATLCVLDPGGPIDRRLLRGVDADGVRGGWDSPYYGVNRPALTYSASSVSALPQRWVTLIALGVQAAVIDRNVRTPRWRLGDGAELSVALNDLGRAGSAVRRVWLES